MISLQYHSLTLHHGSTAILDGIDLDFRGPGVCALLGPSGVGKSSLLRSTQRLIEGGRDGWRRSGDVTFNGNSVFAHRTSRQQIARQIGLIQQNPRMLAGSVRANVEFALKHTTRRKQREIRIIAEESLERVGLAGELPHLDFAAWKLSGGQAQRLAIARAIALDPQVLLMDEPTTSLDPLKAERVEQVIRSVAAERLVVLVTHDVQLASRIADFAAYMFRGASGARIVESGDVPAVTENPTQTEVREFVRTGLASGVATSTVPSGQTTGKLFQGEGDTLVRLLRLAAGVTQVKRPLQRMYLFVCGGNTFRSPLAQAFCNAEIAELLGVPMDELERIGIHATSAGLSAKQGEPLMTMASEALDALDSPSLRHTARPITQSLVNQADVIVCMTRGQCQSLTEKFPDASTKVMQLDPQADIPDHHQAAGGDALPLARRIRGLVRQQLANDLLSHLTNA